MQRITQFNWGQLATGLRPSMRPKTGAPCIRAIPNMSFSSCAILHKKNLIDKSLKKKIKLSRPAPTASAVPAAQMAPLFEEEPSPQKEEETQSSEERYQNPEEEVVIYTCTTSYPVKLVLVCAFFGVVLCLQTADAFVNGLGHYDSETDTWTLAPQWERYLCGGALGLGGMAIVYKGILKPARIVTQLKVLAPTYIVEDKVKKLVLEPNTLVALGTPISSWPLLKPRKAALRSIKLYGPLTDGPRSYHPPLYSAPETKGWFVEFFREMRNKAFIKLPRKGLVNYASGAAPIIVHETALYTLDARRGHELRPFEKEHAWCLDWDALDRVLLVPGAHTTVPLPTDPATLASIVRKLDLKK